MLTALRRRLTLLMTALTSLVLAGPVQDRRGDAAHAELFCHR